MPFTLLAPGAPRLKACLTAVRGDLSPRELAVMRRRQEQRGLSPEPGVEASVKAIVDGLQGDSGLATQTMSYIIPAWQQTAAVEHIAAGLFGTRRGDSIMQTIGERIVERATPGILEQARPEIMAAGMAEMLIRLMSRRFGSLPDGAEARVMQAGVDDLNAWADRLADDAPDLGAVFNGEGMPPAPAATAAREPRSMRLTRA